MTDGDKPAHKNDGGSGSGDKEKKDQAESGDL